MTKKYLYGIFILAGAVLTIWYGIWLQGSAVMKNAILEFVDVQSAAGHKVHYQTIKTSGFPFLLRGKIAAPTVVFANGNQWTGDQFYIDADITAPNRLIFSPRGPHHLSQPSGKQWTLKDDSVRASIESRSNGGWLAKVAGDRLYVSTITGEHLLALTYLANIQPSKMLDDTFEASLIIGPSALDGGAYEGHPVKINSFEFAGRLNFASVLSSGNISQWRANDGTIEIERARLESEGAIISLSGLLTIDDQGFPEGRLTAQIDNPGKLAPLLTGLGKLSTIQADAAQSALIFIGLATGNKIEAPIDFKNGEAVLMGIKVAELPQLSKIARYP